MPRTAAPSRLRLWIFRLTAVALGVLPFVAAELSCRLGGWGRPTSSDDPFVGFSSVHPLFEHDAEQNVYRVAPSRLKFFAQESFPATKSPQAFRIFCLGGSTVQGRPYSLPTSFPTWLRLALQEADPRHEWQVVNCGGISYASYRLVPILEECLQYQPDLIVLCTGHNEFLEDRSYGHLKTRPRSLSVPLELASRSQLVTLLRELKSHLSATPTQTPQRALLPDETDPILDYHDSLKAYHRDDAWRRGVVAHYGFNVRRMAAMAREAGVPLLLMLPPSNLGDSPPFKSESRSDLSGEQLAACRRLKAEARAKSHSDLSHAAARLERALTIDDQHAATWYDLGQCYCSLGEFAKARAAFVKARDLDVCPLRMISPLEGQLREIAGEEEAPLLDAHAVLEQRCRQGILGDWLLVDHVHPSFKGHQLIANALVEELSRLEIVSPAPDWKIRAERAYQQHFESLDSLYFRRGRRTLEAVRGWTRGEADGPPAETRFPQRIGGRTPHKG